MEVGQVGDYCLLKAVAQIIVPVKPSFAPHEGTSIVRDRKRPSWITLKANSYKKNINGGTVYATNQHRTPTHLIGIHIHLPQIPRLLEDLLPFVPFSLARRIQDVPPEVPSMEDDKWVHGICRPEDAIRQTRLGCDFFFALFGWANERTKTEEI